MSSIENIQNISPLQSSLATQATSRSTPAPDQHAAATLSNHSRVQHTASVRADQANLSRASVLISQALSLPDVRADKVVKIQQALAAGTYNVSSSAVAGKLIDTLQAA